MTATQVVRMTGEEAQLLRSLDKLIQKETAHAQKLKDTGSAAETAGRRSGRAFDDLGRKGSNAGDKVRRSLHRASSEGTSGFEKFGKAALTSVVGVVGGIASLATAIQKVNQFLEEQKTLLNESLTKQNELATSQQETFKNLAGLKRAEKLGLIEGVPELARRTGFRDLGALTEGLGSAVSAGAGPSEARSAVTAAARLSLNTPEAVPGLSAAAIDLRRATGISSGEENLGFLSLAGTQARVVDPNFLAENIAPALISSVASVRDQDKVEASRQAAAIFAAFSKATGDKTGKKSGTATVQFAAELNRFFGDLEGQRIEARSKIDLIGRKDDPTEADIANRQRLEAFVDATDGFKDPATLFGRIEALQSNAAIRDQFQTREFGDTKFKQAFKDTADAGSDVVSDLRDAFETIQVSREAFASQAADVAGGTNILRTSSFQQAFEASRAAATAGDDVGALRALVRNETEKVLAESRTTLLGGFRSFGVQPSLLAPGGLEGESVAGEAFSAINKLAGRARGLAQGGLTAEERPKFQQVRDAIDTLGDIAVEAVRRDPSSVREPLFIAKRTAVRATADFGTGSLPTPEGLPGGDRSLIEFYQSIFKRMADSIDAQNELIKQQTAAAEQTADNTRPRPGTIDRGSVQRSARQ